jgi:hypothetical protein
LETKFVIVSKRKVKLTTTFKLKIFLTSQVQPQIIRRKYIQFQKKKVNIIFLDELKKPFRQYELIIAVGNENMNENYDERNEKDREKVSIQRRLDKEGIINNKEESIIKRLRR